MISVLDQSLFILQLLSGSCPSSGLKSFVWGALIPMFSSLQCPLCLSYWWTCPECIAVLPAPRTPLPYSLHKSPAGGENPLPHPGKTASLAAVSCGSFLALKRLAGSPCDMALPPAWAAPAKDELDPGGILTCPRGCSPQSCCFSPWIQAGSFLALLTEDGLCSAVSHPSLQLCAL